MVVGVLALAALPSALAAAELGGLLDLLDAFLAVPAAVVLGVAAILLARRGLRRTERTLGRVGGGRTARVGRALGRLGVAVGLAGAIAIGFYWYLEHIA